MRENIASQRRDGSRYLMFFAGCSLKTSLPHARLTCAPQKYLCFNNGRKKLLCLLRKLI
jgi:hypothetical protein